MRIATFCAGRRGLRFLEKLRELAPDDQLVVFSFPEEAHEPPFLDDIRALARAAGATFLEARGLEREDLATFFRDTPIDLLLAVGWRYLIPRKVHGRARLGAFVVHDSLLPRYRGFSPTVWALVNGEPRVGATLFRMVDEVDAGPIVDQAAIEVGPDQSIAEVMEQVTGLYLALLERNLCRLRSGAAVGEPQDERLATFTCRRLPEDNRIDWAAPARRVHDLVRAVARPYPGAFTTFSGRVLRIWSARWVEPGRRFVGAVPGRVTRILPGEGVAVLAGDGEIQLGEVQLEGEPPARADQVVRSLSTTLGR